MYTDVHYLVGRLVAEAASFPEHRTEDCPMAEYDSPWKEALDEYFGPFLQLCFPTVHREIDWARDYVPLDKELQKIAPKGEVGQRVADKLMRVWRNSGDEEWILVHVEVQNQKRVIFPERMFIYYYRLRDRYNRQVARVSTQNRCFEKNLGSALRGADRGQPHRPCRVGRARTAGTSTS